MTQPASYDRRHFFAGIFTGSAALAFCSSANANRCRSSKRRIESQPLAYQNRSLMFFLAGGGRYRFDVLTGAIYQQRLFVNYRFNHRSNTYTFINGVYQVTPTWLSSFIDLPYDSTFSISGEAYGPYPDSRFWSWQSSTVATLPPDGALYQFGFNDIGPGQEYDDMIVKVWRV